MAPRPTVAAAAVTALLLCGCGATPDAPPPAGDVTPSADVERRFLADVDAMSSMTTEELVSTAQDLCFELELHVETRSDLRAFLKLYAARMSPSTDAEHLGPLLDAVITHYCPEQERVRELSPRWNQPA